MEPHEKALITVHETYDQGRAAIIKMALQEADVPFTATNDIIAGIGLPGMGGIRIQVLDRDVERAREVLRRGGFAT
ncbi:MAG: DUF2007 domain-containing protein [Planctomycetes bacterium]|mgnify:CR=1 FL=1|nr:DUF2007 domain-containing protein [Planctomycetota bacterium]